MTTIHSLVGNDVSRPIVETGVERIVLAHGGGGELTGQLIAERIMPALANEDLATLDDSAVLPWCSDHVVFTTDSYVVTPLEFPGGDIGALAVAGTVNDLAVMGAEPVALSLGLIIEEGLPLETLDRIVASISQTAKRAGIRVVTGDTKVIERRTGEGLFVNTAGVGRLIAGCRMSMSRVTPGDQVLVSGTLGEHGLTIMSVRGGIQFDTTLRSDVTPLNGMIRRLVTSGAEIKFMRDATRGGLAGVLADVSERSGFSVEIEESALPMTIGARYAADMLGLDPLTIANEGKIVCVVANRDADAVCDMMRACAEGRHAAIIGRVVDSTPPLVELKTTAGGARIVQRPYGEELPRIC
ncbi:MAG: hydrogenase expression/formation protein HypE [Phycisphaerales bacterium]|nr:hydrogenase expression/formation protein HypE [Phycisphaerales bacterium]MCB9854368.1 hydrogenase expression/formation protein HypE [Phycisphaerales bacterium]MCB9863569.1 hydrogenase expression/formation protein HypE [Phycisphaerales bacterium]